MLKKLWNNKWILRSILKTIYFNFRYLPIAQAVKLPILLYKASLKQCRGSVEIKAKQITTGMIKLGINRVSIYPNTGFFYENHGGRLVFKGKCTIGNNSYISIGKDANLIFGDSFSCSTSMKCVCYKRVEFQKDVRVGWDCIFMDTDFHCMKTKDGQKTKGYGSILVGEGNWIGSKCMILKNTKTSNYNTISANSLTNRDLTIFADYSVLGGCPVKLIAKGLYRDFKDDVITYED